jgi:nitroreductase
VPGLRLTDSVFAPPLKVGVAPTLAPLEDSIVTLCGNGDLLVKSIDTCPAFALSVFVLYLSWPSGFASRLTLEDPPELVLGAGVVDAAELVLGGAAAVLAEDELELEELPHPASASSAAVSDSVATENTERFVAWAAGLMSDPPLVGVVGCYDTARYRSFPVAVTDGRHRQRQHTLLATLARSTVSPVDLEQAVRTRRTHKAFGPEPVDRAVLDELFELARWAPNHHLTNPWRFRVLGPRSRERLMELAEASQPGSAVKLRRAPTLVVVSVDGAAAAGDAAQAREDLLATAVAAYIVLLGAHARGLAGYWRTVPLLESSDARALLGLGAQESPLGLLYLGTPVQEQRVPDRAAPGEFSVYLD